jgi:hypothetical protein
MPHTPGAICFLRIPKTHFSRRKNIAEHHLAMPAQPFKTTFFAFALNVNKGFPAPRVFDDRLRTRHMFVRCTTALGLQLQTLWLA